MASIFHFGENEYDYEYLQQSFYTPKELRAEASRLRSIARKRLNRLSSAGYEESATYQNNMNLYRSIRDLNDREVAAYLQDVYEFLDDPISTIKGYREYRTELIEALHQSDKPIDFSKINDENFDSFTRFMEHWRNQKLDREYDSTRIANLFISLYPVMGNRTEEIMTNFDQWLENEDRIKKLGGITYGRGKRHTAAWIAKRLGIS